MDTAKSSGENLSQHGSNGLVARIARMERAHWRKHRITHEEELKVGQEFKQQQLDNPDVPAYDLPAGMKLVASMPLYVQYIAQKMSKRKNVRKELYQEGYLGCVEAIKRYDPDLGGRFVTYAKWWIFASMKRYLDNNLYVARIPQQAMTNIRKINYILDNYPEAEFGKSYEAYVADAKYHGNKNSLELSQSEYESTMLNHIRYFPYLLDAKSTALNEYTDENIFVSIPDRGALPDELTMEQDRRDLIGEVLSLLSEREQYIIREYFGITESQDEHTLEEIGDDLQLTRERVRQIKSKTLHKIREDPRYVHLADYL